MGWEQTASGYAGVWATDNTREALFDAMQRKEIYATTGPRMIVRFFGGWDFEPDDANTRNPAIIGYGKGVPMGGDLMQAPAGKTPSFLVAALKDPTGANIDRIEIIKGWLDTRAKPTKKSTMSPGPETANRTQKASFPPSGTPWMFPTQPTATPSAQPN